MARETGGPGLRARVLAAVCASAACASAACVGAPAPEDLLAVGFRTPRQAFATFQTAVRGDLLDLEYRCWSAGFRRANRLSQQLYREGRRQLQSENPFLRWIARAEVVEEEPLGPAAHRLVCVVELLWIERRFEVRLVRDDFLELWGGRDELRLLYDDYCRFDDLVRVVPHPDGGWDLQVAAELWEENAYTDDPTRPTELRIAHDWKIDDLRPVDAAGDEAGREAP